MKTKKKIRTVDIVLPALLILTILCFFGSVFKTNAYNRKDHNRVLSGPRLFGEEESDEALSVKAIPRGSTWSKAFDINNEGITEHNFQAFTYDFNVSNNTGDEVSDFKFKLIFDKEVFLMSAWNGSLEIHQFRDNLETVSEIPDLRDYNADDYPVDTSTYDGEVLVHMKAGDFLVYIPSSSESASEIPIEAHEGTVPGIILYAPIGKDISGSTLELSYHFHRLLRSEPLFWISLIGLLIWTVALIIFLITSSQIKKYKERHERDNVIIRESIETFTGFIDAKDPYTNGHSNRVAEYTRLIAEKMGYEGDELNRAYYIALLHDCGKIGVPDNILRKPGKLDDEEFKIIKSHTVIGCEILSSFKSLKNAGEGALYHHERYDGRGYPEGKKGEDIPLIARMICVADSFDAMNSNRVYRKKLTKEDILNEIETNKGKQFDPDIADIFLRLIKNGTIEMV